MSDLRIHELIMKFVMYISTTQQRHPHEKTNPLQTHSCNDNNRPNRNPTLTDRGGRCSRHADRHRARVSGCRVRAVCLELFFQGAEVLCIAKSGSWNKGSL